jgi:hypothetical protein
VIPELVAERGLGRTVLGDFVLLRAQFVDCGLVFLVGVAHANSFSLGVQFLGDRLHNRTDEDIFRYRSPRSTTSRRAGSAWANAETLWFQRVPRWRVRNGRSRE